MIIKYVINTSKNFQRESRSYVCMSFALCSTLAYYLYDTHYQLLNYFLSIPNTAQYCFMIIKLWTYSNIKAHCSPQLASRGEPLFVRVSIFWRDPEPGFFWSGTRILGINYHWLDYQVIHRYININIVGESGFRLYIDIIVCEADL